MVSLEPKSHFARSHSDADKAWLTNELSHPMVRTAMVYATSVMVEQGATQEELKGAKRFRDILINLAEPPEPKPTFPEKKLQALG